MNRFPHRPWAALTSVALLAACTAPPYDPVNAGESWFSSPVMPEARAALSLSDAVSVSTRGVLTLAPRTGPVTAGLVIYPGAFVDPRAYAPQARALAERGYLVALLAAPFGFAIANSDAALEVLARPPAITRRAVAGHSLGGVAASDFAARHSDRVQGLVLWAAYPADSTDLSVLPLKVTSLYGTLDGRSRPETVLKAASRLPKDATFVAIEGGNHAQFGSYGPQAGDLEPTISRTEQLQKVVDGTLAVLEALSAAPSSEPS